MIGSGSPRTLTGSPKALVGRIRWIFFPHSLFYILLGDPTLKRGHRSACDSAQRGQTAAVVAARAVQSQQPWSQQPWSHQQPWSQQQTWSQQRRGRSSRDRTRSCGERRATRTGGASSWPTPRPHEHHPCCHPAREPLSVSRSDKGEREGREGGGGAAYIASPLCCLSLVAAPPTASHATHLRIAPPHPGDRPPQQVKKLGLEHVCTPDGGAQQPRQQLGQQTWCAIASSGTGRRSLKRLVPLDLRAVTWTTAVSTSTSSGTYIADVLQPQQPATYRAKC